MYKLSEQGPHCSHYAKHQVRGSLSSLWSHCPNLALAPCLKIVAESTRICGQTPTCQQLTSVLLFEESHVGRTRRAASIITSRVRNLARTVSRLVQRARGLTQTCWVKSWQLTGRLRSRERGLRKIDTVAAEASRHANTRRDSRNSFYTTSPQSTCECHRVLW